MGTLVHPKECCGPCKSHQASEKDLKRVSGPMGSAKLNAMRGKLPGSKNVLSRWALAGERGVGFA